MLINDYIRPAELENFCKRIDLPAEVTEKVMHCVNTWDFKIAAPYFSGILSTTEGFDAAKKMEDACVEADRELGQWMLLTAMLAAGLRTEEMYAEKGIPGDIYTASMKGFTRFIGETIVSYGEYRFDRGFWVHRCLSGALYRLGALEFEMRYLNYDKEFEGYAKFGDEVLSVHIPSNAVMTREALDDSYRQAEAFFAKYFSDFNYACIYCDSWLMSPALRECLPVNSRILEFQSDYDIIKWYEDNTGFYHWVYKRKYADNADLPEDTRLQRDIKKRLLAGLPIGSGIGVKKAHRQFH
jgi:hypothetical protein